MYTPRVGEITLDLAHYSGFGFLVARVTLYLGLFFVSGLAGSRSDTSRSTLCCNLLLGLSSSLEGICWVFPVDGFPRIHLVFMLVSFLFCF